MIPNDENRLLLTVEEAAQALSIGRSTFYELLKAGEISSVKIRGATRIKPGEVERFFESLPAARYAPLGPKQGVHA